MEQYSSTVDDLQIKFESLTPAPRISKSLKGLVTDGSIDPDEIIALIRLEPLLAARIMREANQMPNARQNGYACIEESVTAVGFERMYDLLGIYAYQYSESGESISTYSTERWKRAITCAVCMESLAVKHKLDPHLAYSVGLLHSLASAIMESEESDAAQPNDNLLDRLNSRLKTIGGSGLSYNLFKEWGFPERFTDPVRFQFSPLDSKSMGKIACLLNLAKWITGVIREVDELPDQAIGPDVLVLNLLGEGEQTLWNLVTEVSDGLHKADAILHGRPNSLLESGAAN